VGRDTHIAALLERDAEDKRRLGLDAADDNARQTNTWGTTDHRRTRDSIERTYDEARRAFERMSDAELDALVSTSSN